MFKFADIFNVFYTIYDKLSDPNKDAQGKGTQERYIECIGDEIDEEIVPYVENMQKNLKSPLTAFDRYVPYLESELGYSEDWYWFFNQPISFRRHLRAIMPKLYTIRGTLLAHEIMFAWVGITGVTITEETTGGEGFDHDTETWDSDDRPTLDSGCPTCSKYSFDLTGGASFGHALVEAIGTILVFNQPINAILEQVTYNGVIIPLTNFTFPPNFNTV